MISFIASLLASASVASADINKVTLSVESKNATLDGKFLTALHESAGISSIFLTSSPQQYIYNSTSNTVSYDVMLAGQYYMTLAEYGQGLAATVTGPPYALLKDDYLTINGSSTVFYACNSLAFDPYGYSKSSTGVAVYGSNEKVPDGCQGIKIKGDIGDSVDSGSSSTAEAGAAAATTSDASSTEESTTEESTQESTTANSTETSAESSSATAAAAATTTSSAHNSTTSVAQSSSTHTNSTSSHSSVKSSTSAHSHDAAVSAGLGGGLIAGIAYFLL